MLVGSRKFYFLSKISQNFVRKIDRLPNFPHRRHRLGLLLAKVRSHKSPDRSFSAKMPRKSMRSSSRAIELQTIRTFSFCASRRFPFVVAPPAVTAKPEEEVEETLSRRAYPLIITGSAPYSAKCTSAQFSHLPTVLVKSFCCACAICCAD